MSIQSKPFSSITQDEIYMQINSLIGCCQRGDFEKLQLHLADCEFDSAIKSYSHGLAYDAVVHGTPQTARLMLADPRVDPSGNDNAALLHAVHNRKLDMVRLLIENDRLDPLKLTPGQTIMQFAQGRDNVAMIRLLLQNQKIASIPIEVNLALRYCAHKNADIDFLCDLITKYGANAHYKGHVSWPSTIEYVLDVNFESLFYRLMHLPSVVNGLRHMKIDGSEHNQSYHVCHYLYCIGYRSKILNDGITTRMLALGQSSLVEKNSISLLLGLATINLPVLLKCHLIEIVNEPLSHCVSWHWLWLYASNVI